MHPSSVSIQVAYFNQNDVADQSILWKRGGMKYFLFDIGNVLVDFEFVKQLEGIAAGTGRPTEPLTDIPWEVP